MHKIELMNDNYIDRAINVIDANHELSEIDDMPPDSAVFLAFLFGKAGQSINQLAGNIWNGVVDSTVFAIDPK